MPKISIIIPIYNVQDCIIRCLDSIINQDLGDCEVIFVDDHGSDKSIDIVKEYISNKKTEKQFIFTSTKCNSGPAIARNKGLEVATGEYIAFMDADDWADSNMYSALYNKAIEYQADICYCNAKSNGKILKNPTITSGPINEIGKKLFLLTYVAYLWTGIYKRSFLLQNNIVFYNHRSSEDSCFIALAMMYAKTIASIETPLYNYTINSSSISNKKNSERCIEKMNAFIHLINDSKAREIYNSFEQELNYIFIKKGYLTACIDYKRNVDFIRIARLKELRKKLTDTLPDYKANVYFRNNKKLRLLNFILP